MKKQIEKILQENIRWDYTAYHGDVVILGKDKAAERLEKYFNQKIRYERSKWKRSLRNK